MLVTLLGIVRLEIFGLWLNAPSGIAANPVPIVRVVRAELFANA